MISHSYGIDGNGFGCSTLSIRRVIDQKYVVQFFASNCNVDAVSGVVFLKEYETLRLCNSECHVSHVVKSFPVFSTGIAARYSV